jgi:hypothetical protein
MVDKKLIDSRFSAGDNFKDSFLSKIICKLIVSSAHCDMAASLLEIANFLIIHLLQYLHDYNAMSNGQSRRRAAAGGDPW